MAWQQAEYIAINELFSVPLREQENSKPQNAQSSNIVELQNSTSSRKEGAYMSDQNMEISLLRHDTTGAIGQNHHHIIMMFHRKVFHDAEDSEH